MTKCGAFMVLEIDVSQAKGNVKILHLKLDYLCTGIHSTRSLFSTSVSYIRGYPGHWGYHEYTEAGGRYTLTSLGLSTSETYCMNVGRYNV